jgi:dTDP-4-amino-4,6-dideoxygalactose transaminase
MLKKKRQISLFRVRKMSHTKYLDETLDSGFYAEGPKVAEFEKQLSKFVVSVVYC